MALPILLPNLQRHAQCRIDETISDSQPFLGLSILGSEKQTPDATHIHNQ